MSDLLNLDEERLDHLERLAPSDVIGTEAFSAWHGERRVLRWGFGVTTTLLAIAVGVIVVLALRKPYIVWIRVDDIRGAQAIQYSSLQYTPTEGVVRKSLDDWAKLFFPRLRSTVIKSHAQGFYFIDSASGYSSRLQQTEFKSKQIPMIVAGKLPEYDAIIQHVQITSLNKASSADGYVVWVGTAQFIYQKAYPTTGSIKEHREEWGVNINFIINPEQVAEQSRKYPEYQFINPLGISISEIHEAQIIQ